MRWFLLMLWLLLAAVPVLADGSDWIIAKPAPIDSDWTIDPDGSYVRFTSRRPTSPATPSTTAQTRTESVPAVTRTYPTTPATIAQVVAPVSISWPVSTWTERTITPVPYAARRGGISFGVSAGACVGGG